MNHFLSLAVAAIFLSLALAQEDDYHENERNKDVGDGYYSNRPYYGGSRYGNRHGGRYGGSYGGRSHGGYGGYGYAYKKCPELEDLENGDIKIFGGLRPRSRAVHYCIVGFNLVGKKVRICQRDGTWSDDAPTCEPVDCGEPDEANPNSSRDVEGTTLKELTTYTCDTGYLIDVNQGGSDVIICQANGEWSDTAPVCIPVDCGYPPEEDVNGQRVVTGTILDSTATYTCNTGFELDAEGDSVVLTCQADGNWSPATAPACIPVDCGPEPAADPNGDVDVRSTTFRSTAVYSCNSGYVLDTANGGSQQVECLANGAWSGFAAACSRIDCGFLPAPRNGAVVFVEDTRLDSYAQFSCSRGFKLVGDVARRCQANGDWSLAQPTCERIICPKLNAPDHGKVVSTGNFVDDKATYSCAYGFTLNGNRVRECQEDGTWSGTDPTCEKDKKYGDYGYHGGYGGPRYGGHHGGYYDDDDKGY